MINKGKPSSIYVFLGEQRINLFHGITIFFFNLVIKFTTRSKLISLNQTIFFTFIVYESSPQKHCTKEITILVVSFQKPMNLKKFV